MRLDVYHHFPPTDTSVTGKLDAILARLDEQGDQMSELGQSFTDMKERVLVDVRNLQQRNEQLGQQLIEAMSNDAADAATIAQKQAELDSARAEDERVIAELDAFDPVPDEAPPGDGGAEPPPGG